MVAAQVIGNDATVCAAAQSGTFQLNVMQPVAAYNLLQSVALLAAACRHLAGSIAPMRYHEARLGALLARNSMLVTALAPRIGYAEAARIAKQAMAADRPVLEVAVELSGLPREELEGLLDPARMAAGGLR
jgi:fumarate hydratase class II